MKTMNLMKGFFPGSMVDFWNDGLDSIRGEVEARPKNQRSTVAEYYGCKGIGQGDAFLATCCVTGLEGTGSGKGTREGKGAVVVSHNLGRKRPVAAFERFDLDIAVDADNPRNTILVLKSIEQYYETKKLCFVPSTPDLDQWDGRSFRMMIMDPSIREDPVFIYDDGRPNPPSFGHYENESFEFPEGKTPFTRILSHHAQCSYRHAVNVKWIDPEVRGCPPHYGSPLKNDTLVIDLAQTLSPSQKQSIAWDSPRVKYLHQSLESDETLPASLSTEDDDINPTNLFSNDDDDGSY